ncbi:MAG: polyprenyl synthetase family protein, partial [Deltaproteobacteria bacterium]|nr:polyprenyl synthetase family protein [Deltaproteobacteria bacterium]
NLGIAFQMIDDMLDYTSCEEEFGKPVGKDLREGKITLPLIYALSELEDKETERLQVLFRTQDVDAGEYDRLIETVRKYRTIERVRSEAMEYSAKAASCLEGFDPSTEKEQLLDLNEYLVTRAF